ncbi:sulfurtransferase-like selenium metabolism protein YedF [Chloroflexota bacterium]
MPEIVDARGMDCPHPVILTKRALEEADEVITIVDNKTASENVSRLAASQGCWLVVQKHDDGIYLQLRKKVVLSKEYTAAPASGSTLLLIASDTMGRGEEKLGSILMRNFIHALNEVAPRPEKIIFINSGVKLLTGGSWVIEDLLDLEKEGVEVLACGTCVGHYDLKEDIKVGQVSNMYDIASAMLEADKVVSV